MTRCGEAVCRCQNLKNVESVHNLLQNAKKEKKNPFHALLSKSDDTRNVDTIIMMMIQIL